MKKITTFACALLCSICTIMAQETPTGVLMNLYASDMAQPKAISENGKWACGSAFWSGNQNEVGAVNASKWNLETGERIYLQESETELSDALCINNDGTLIGGSYLNAPAYNLNGEWIALPLPKRTGFNGQVIGGEVTNLAIVDTDTIFVGWYYSQTEGKIIRWINGEIDDNFKYRNYTRYTEIMGDTILAEMETVRGMSTDGERILISLDHSLLPSASSNNLPTTLVQMGDSSVVIERSIKGYDMVSFIDFAAMSHNGKFVCGNIYGVPLETSDAQESTLSFSYDVDNDIFTTYGFIEQTQRFAGASFVDNEGHVYFKSINGNNPLGKPYIYKNGEYIELERCLLAYDGITAEQIDEIAEEVAGSDADDLGIVWAVSGDGKTLIGAGDALKGNIWCAKLSCSPYDVDPVVAVENITYDNLAAYYANGAITIKGDAEMIEVYSITGAKVISQVVENSTIKADLRNGIYVVKVYNGNNVATSKIIVK